jgi:hypothetical protein
MEQEYGIYLEQNIYQTFAVIQSTKIIDAIQGSVRTRGSQVKVKIGSDEFHAEIVAVNGMYISILLISL